MRKVLFSVIILTGLLGGSADAGNRYFVREPKPAPAPLHRPAKPKPKPELSFPRIDTSKYIVRPKPKPRYSSVRPSPIKKSSPRFSLLFSKELFKRARCYDPIRKVWINADRKVIDGSVNVGKTGKTLFYRKGALFCVINLTD